MPYPLSLRTPAAVHGSGACGLRRLNYPGKEEVDTSVTAAGPLQNHGGPGFCYKLREQKKERQYGMAMLLHFRNTPSLHSIGSEVLHITSGIYVVLDYSQN